MDTKFVPAGDPALLSKQANEALQACSNLMKTISDSLPEKQLALIGMVMAAGGKVGMELCINMLGQNSVCLVAIEALGQRRPIVEITTIGQPTSPLQ